MASEGNSPSGPSFALSSEQEMIRQTARDFAQKEIAPIAAEFDESGEFPYETIRKMGAMGFMGIEVPEAYGGAGLDTMAYVLALEEISKADAAHGAIMSVNNSLFCYALLRYGTEEQRQKYIEPVASGKVIGAYSLTEPMSGSDAGTMRSRAVRQGEGYVLNGRKSWVTSGPVASYIIVFTMTDPEKKHRGITAFLVDTKAPGFSVGKKEPKLGIRASATSEILFEDYRLPLATRLGEEGEGFKIAMTVLDAGRIGIAAQALGIAEACYEASLAYCPRAGSVRPEDRRVPGRRIQAGRHEDAHRGQPAADLPGGTRQAGVQGQRRALHARGLDGQAVRLRDGHVLRARRGADPRRHGLLEGTAGRALLPRRQDHRDLRGHERDPAYGDRARRAGIAG